AREEFLRIKARRQYTQPHFKSKATVLLRIVIHKRDPVNRFLNICDLNSCFVGLIAGEGYLKPRLKIKGIYYSRLKSCSKFLYVFIRSPWCVVFMFLPW
ncbi:MAG: hypothetical protein J7J82_03305, partial [Staphylothermus sp.]|nr:hypothetical protein [Staphylothermus sp.]